MAEFFEKEIDILEDHIPYGGLYEVFILYFDEERGHIPLLIYPNKSIEQYPEKMRPIYIHSIWFLDIDELSCNDHVDLEYKDKMYFAQKFCTKSEREKRRSGIDKESPEVIVIILALPKKLIVFGSELIQKITNRIIEYFAEELSELIQAEISRLYPIKTAQRKQKIEKANKIKEKIKGEIKSLCNRYFSTVIETPETKSIKEQLEEHGIDIAQKVMAWLGLTVEPMKLKEVAEKLASYDNVIVAAITSGDHDLVVQIIADNEHSLHLFIEKLVKPIPGIHPQMDVSISYIKGSKYLK